MRAAAVWLATGLAASVGAMCGLGCGGGATAPPPAATVAADPQWQDVFDTTPELVAILFPKALRADRVYGPLLRRTIDLVRDRSRVVLETRALEAMEDAEEVIVGFRPDASPGVPAAGGDGSAEVVWVVRGVRADIDPGKLVDADGHPLWAPGPPGAVRELVSAEPAVRRNGSAPDPASLFELPGRTWVIASGDARRRARDAFAHPLGRPPLRFEPRDGNSLAVLRIDGKSLVRHIRFLQPHGGLEAVGRNLESLTLELPSGAAAADAGADRQVRAALAYGNEDSAAFAEVTARDALGAIARQKPDNLAWLGDATVERPGKLVVVTAPLPSRFVGYLLHAGSSAVELRQGDSQSDSGAAP